MLKKLALAAAALILVSCGVVTYLILNHQISLPTLPFSESQTSNVTWVPISVLVNAHVGYTSDNADILFKGQTIRADDSAKVALYSGKLSLPTYGLDLSDSSWPHLFRITKDGAIDSGGSVVDPVTITVFQQPKEDNSCGFKCKYDALDKNSHYLYGEAYPPFPIGADPKTFAVLYSQEGEFTGWGKDKNNVYLEDEASTTFNPVPPGYVPGITMDPNSFQVLGGEYLKDKNHVYCDNLPGYFWAISEADPATFTYDPATDVGKDVNYSYGSDNGPVPCQVLPVQVSPGVTAGLVFSGPLYDFYNESVTSTSTYNPDVYNKGSLVYTKHGNKDFTPTNDGSDLKAHTSTDGKEILVVTPNKAYIYDGYSANGITIYTAPQNTELGTWNLSGSFQSFVTYISTSTTRIYVYPKGTIENPDQHIVPASGYSSYADIPFDYSF